MDFNETGQVLRAARDERAREEFIRREEKNILRIASRAKHRFVTKSDDEWSIALCAFSRAIDTFDRDKGAFSSYAETLIRRALIDAHRAEAKFEREVAVAPEAFDGELDGEAPGAILFAIVESSVRAADTRLRDEILAANKVLGAFGFQFFDLTGCSPRQGRTRSACDRAVRALLRRPEDLERLIRTKKLPIRALAQQEGLSRKLLDQYRRYIIAAAILQTGDFPMLAEYIRGCGRGDES